MSKSAQSTPRNEIFRQHQQAPKALSSLEFGSRLQNLAARRRRMSAEESLAQRRLSTISRASQLSLINNDLNLSPRRVSKMYETGDFSLTFAEQLRLTR
uniref:Uncharacterized protein n=1 Tax=Acrobeloides nanus TaxID=290746 RepID=A0A914DDT0_9BILA